MCVTKYRPLYQVSSTISLPGIVADMEDRMYEEEEEERRERERRERGRFVGSIGLDVKDRLGLFVMVCSALVGVQAMLPKGL